MLSPLIALAIAAAPPVFPWERHEQKLDNGLRTIVVPTDHKGFFALYAVVGTGSRDEVEPGKSGFAHFFEHIMFKGSKKVPSDARKQLLASLGVDESGYTTDDFTTYHLTGPISALSRIIELEGDRFQNLNYSEQEFRVEAGAVLGEYNKNFANPDRKASEALRDLAFDAHTYKHTTMGFLNDIKDMPNGYAYAQSFFQRYYTPDNVLLIIAGDVEVATTHAAVKQAFSSWQGKRTPTTLKDEAPLAKPRSGTVPWDNPTQTRVHLGWRVPSSVTNPRDAALSLVMQHYLFSDSADLVKGLVIGDPTTDRGAPLAEAVQCWFSFHKDASLFPVVVRVKNGKSEADVIERVQGHVDNVANGKINDRRFADVKSHLRYGLLMDLTSADQVASTLAWLSGASMNAAFVDDVYTALQTLTPADLHAFAKAWFGANQRATVILSSGATP